MIGIAIETWPHEKERAVLTWLFQHFGEESKTSWYRHYDFDLIDLVMTEEIYSWYKLKWE